VTSAERRRRGIRLASALALVAGFVVAPVLPAAACACGGVAPSPGSEVSVGEEHAIVSWADGLERIDLLLAVLSTDSDAGLVFPTPSPATVTLGDRADFEAIDRVTTPERVEEYDWWSFGGLGGGATAGAPPEVLDVVQLGPIEATTLAASDASGLQTWLADNDYALSPAVTGLLGGYVDRGWYFVALKLTGETPLDGGLDPLRFTFASDELVYPLELSRAAVSPQTVRLFVFDDHRQTVAFTGTGTVANAYASWAAPVTGTEVEALGAYLTVLELYFPDPGSQILGDLVFADADGDETIGTEETVVVPVGVLGIPLGWLITGFAIVGAVVALLVVSAVGAKRS
jgi:hypothetical protein